MLDPVFVKGQLAMKCDGHHLEYVRRNVSLFGVTGLPWGPLSAQDHFGKPAEVMVKLATPDGFALTASAHVMREYTLYSEHMGVRLKLKPDQATELRQRIVKHGFFPTDYIRKYPRIPSNPKIETYPLSVMVTPEGGSSPIVFGIRDISPNGFLIATENQTSLKLIAGERVSLVIDPRGWFPVQIHCQGMICRITDDLSPESGNLTRYMGMRFTRIDDVNKTAFLDLMRDILSRLKNEEPQ